MGAEALCTVVVGKQSVQGKALLEASELIFRSPDLRLKIPFTSISSVAVDGGSLVVTHNGGRAAFKLGTRAGLWAERIRKPKGLLDKLGIKPEHRVCVIGVPDTGFLVDLKLRAPGVSTRLVRDADAIIYGMKTEAGLAKLGELRYRIKPDGMIWVVTPKGRGGIKDTIVIAAAKAAGLVDVKVAAFSETHTASKFVIPKAMR